MAYPQLTRRKTSRMMIDTFLGYNHNLKIAEGEFYDTVNLTTEHFPLFANRGPRSRWDHVFTNLQGIIAKDALYWVDDGKLFANGNEVDGISLSNEGQKQLVSMGAYIVIFPDKVYYNTENAADYGSLEAEWSYTGNVTYTPCDVDGMPYTINYVSTTEPESPVNGDIWLDAGKMALFQYSSVQVTWIAIESVYTAVMFETQGQIGQLFKTGDGITVSGLYYDALNGSKAIVKMGGEALVTNDYVVLVGLCGQTSTQSGTVTLSRTVPQMDYVCECQNRLWGCYYGMSEDGNSVLNEIYCCALGDFKNWRQYQGISTDSWTASVGSDGEWTGAVNYRGHPTFFKENRIHVVTVSAAGAHRLEELLASGVQKGSWRSLAIANEVLYYKTRTAVVAWQGGMPKVVSAALGDEKRYDACAGVYGQRYYISMRNAHNDWNLFVYDTEHGLWMKEDWLKVERFAQLDDELYAQVEMRVGNYLVDRILGLNGTVGYVENPVQWTAETGIMYYEYPDQKYVSRYDIRLQMGTNASMTLYLEYDSDTYWHYAGQISATATTTKMLPVRPRRCDHLRMRFVGQGEIRIFSIAKILVKGSDA